MTYNFDPERWYENEYAALEVLHKKGDLNDKEFEQACTDLLDRYDEMLTRLDGTFQLPNDKRCLEI